jgi:multiple sugar transport system substrate-binding protein
MAGNGYLTPFSKFGYTADADFVQRSLDVCTWPPPFGPRTPGTAKDAKGELYALPELGNVQMFWYRKDLMSEPKDIADLIAQTKAKADPAKGVYGYSYRTRQPGRDQLNAWNRSYGGDILTIAGASSTGPRACRR